MSERLDGVEYPESVADAGYAHLLEGELIKLEENITPDVVCPESGCMVCALDIGEPAGDVGIRPRTNILVVSQTGWWICHFGKWADVCALLGLERCRRRGWGREPRGWLGQVVHGSHVCIGCYPVAVCRVPVQIEPNRVLFFRFSLSLPFLSSPTMRFRTALSLWPLLAAIVAASPYRSDIVEYNLNTNQDAQSPLEYSTNRRASYTPSPDNWRALPVYTILMDKFADGDPSNNDFFGTPYENDWRETQLRNGGDLKGLVAKLDYLAGMGIKVIFISGTPFLNMLWQADSESPPLFPRPSLLTLP